MFSLSLVNFGSRFFSQGFHITNMTTSTVTYAKGSCRNAANDFVLEQAGNAFGVPASITLDVNQVGVNGTYSLPLSDLVIPSNQYVAVPVWAIGDSSGAIPNIGMMVGLDPSATLLPPGYDSAARIGVLMINSSYQIVPMQVNGIYESQTYTYLTSFPILTAGNSTTPSQIAFNGGFPVYMVTRTLTMTYSFTSASASDSFSIAPAGFTLGANSPVHISNGFVGTAIGTIQLPVNYYPGSSSQQVFYSVTNPSSSLSLWLSSFDLDIPFDSGLAGGLL